MLEEDIISFYEKHDINPGAINTYFKYLSVVFAAFPNGEIFTSFVKKTFISIDNNKFKSNFDSWEELMNDYCFFVSEHYKNKYL